MRNGCWSIPSVVRENLSSGFNFLCFGPAFQHASQKPRPLVSASSDQWMSPGGFPQPSHFQSKRASLRFTGESSWCTDTRASRPVSREDSAVSSPRAAAAELAARIRDPTFTSRRGCSRLSLSSMTVGPGSSLTRNSAKLSSSMPTNCSLMSGGSELPSTSTHCSSSTTSRWMMSAVSTARSSALLVIFSAAFFSAGSARIRATRCSPAILACSRPRSVSRP
mmetsp:Transcript_27644/g.78213  ORF Transcript_27644/g.78213 Transcript_27644/m.78213 type:complete len:222 (+) Transcript_27644:830-1495(+)